MFWSKNNTFYKSSIDLDKIEKDIEQLLSLKGRSIIDIINYKIAFNFFRGNRHLYDGATIVKDLNDLPNLDLDAMLHDFLYLQGANKSFVQKWKVDVQYIKNMEKNGKGIRVFRFLLLTVIGIVFVPYSKYKNK